MHRGNCPWHRSPVRSEPARLMAVMPLFSISMNSALSGTPIVVSQPRSAPTAKSRHADDELVGVGEMLAVPGARVRERFTRFRRLVVRAASIGRCSRSGSYG